MISSALPQLELRHLRTLAAIAETHSLSKAAARLHLTQPAISHQVKVLEDLYGLSLFERKTVPLRLTSAGRRLLALSGQVEGLVTDAERDLAKLAGGRAGELRIAVECHSCFDWLMPSMDAFREQWPEVDLDLVSGFHADPAGLLTEGKADLVIVSHAVRRPGLSFFPLFGYEVCALVANSHPLASRTRLLAPDFAQETLITYPIPDERIDLLRDFLGPAGVEPGARRAAMLTVAILQLVASGRGIAGLPRWAVQPFLDRHYVTALPVGRRGLFSSLNAAMRAPSADEPWMMAFVETMRRVSFSTLADLLPVSKLKSTREQKRPKP